ncbi:MAG: peptidoglycan DD-metalloendopeptidase family protein [Clostridiales bacterium]|nr:peptidoglycan DD-metalloendopeptidase family protein [Clostridiales bacterium]
MKAANVQIKIRRKKKKRLFLLAFCLLALAVLIFFPVELVLKKKGEPEGVEVAPAIKADVPHLVEYKEHLRAGNTISEVISNYGFTPGEIHTLYEQTKPVYDLRFIRAGREFRLFASPEGKIVRLEYDIDDTRYLSIQRSGEKFSAAVATHPVQTEVNYLCGVIEDNPILTFNELGEADALGLAFSDLFAWDIDFYVDLRQGDTFKVILEKIYLKGKFVGYGNIVAAELVNRGKVFQAYRFVRPDTQKPGYYDAEGKSLKKEFIKSPIKWARITSRFSQRRLHPIHQVYRAHFGVDYAAPVGTPVQATADGTVIHVGFNGASGRMVRIRHKNAYETMYLHLRGYGPGIKVGARVKSGDIVGYVGSSGEATGPHLDYRIKLKGRYINPLSWKFEPVEPLKEELVDDFKRHIEPCRVLLENPLLLISPGVL